MESFLTEPNGCNVYIFQLNNADSCTETPVHLLVDSYQLQENTNQCVDQENNKAESLNLDMLPATVCHDIEDNEEQVFTLNDNESSHIPVEPTNQTTNKITEMNNCVQNSDYKNIMSENWCQINKHEIPNNVHISDRIVPPKAVAVLPVELQLRHGLISSRRTLPARTRFGPVQGIQTIITPAQADEFIKVAADVHNPIFLLSRTDESMIHIDTSDMDKSNWLSLLRVGDDNSANVWLYEENGGLYGMTVQPIPSRTPLMFGYSLQYAKDHGISPGQPVINLREVCKKWCLECRIAEKKSMSRELKKIFKEKTGFGKNNVGHYRCTYCLKTFRRLFTLKRHKRLMCSKKREKSVKTPDKDMSTISQSNVCNNTVNTSYMDDCRVPSDESFNNFTNILDFPTNLFDTDRINLDISGSSRSENEFNFGNEGVQDPVNVETPINEKATKENDDILTTCPYCTEVIVKDKYRQHFRTCPKRCKCVCGQVFNRKQSLIMHIRLEHPGKLKQATQNTNDMSNKSADNKYKCNECEQNFKRRGMLVNHLWRTHNKAPTSVPLERRVRHYPCGVGDCPKIYCTKAKRDVHVAKHHPGCEVKAVPIEEAPRVIPPAACPACPRQYATRAKLMQHVRHSHPDMYQTMDTTTQPQSTGLT